MAETRDRAYDLATADCHRCVAVNGEEMHLWFDVRDDGSVWTWLQESILPAVVFTPAQTRQLLDGWRQMLDLLHRGDHTDQQIAVQAHTPETGQLSVIVFGLREGNMTYWRNGEDRDLIELDIHNFRGLVESWSEVCDRSRLKSASGEGPAE